MTHLFIDPTIGVSKDYFILILLESRCLSSTGGLLFLLVYIMFQENYNIDDSAGRVIITGSWPQSYSTELDEQKDNSAVQLPD